RLRGVDDRRRLVDETFCVSLDLRIGEDGPGGRTAGWVSDPCRVVADDQDSDVPLALEGGHPLKWDAVAQRHVARGHVDAELDAERPPERELRLESALGQDLDGSAR